MSVVKRNIAANFGGNAWTALMSLIFVPLYIRFMGIEAYGLLGFFATLLGLFALLDMGLSSTLNREMARLSVQNGRAQQMCDLVRTLEIPYWLVGGIIAATVVLASPLIAYHWVQTENLSPSSVRTAVILMGLCVAFQWPTSFYSGGLMGLQRQVLLNGINVVIATVRGVGAVLVLWLISPTVEAFFTWQIAVSAMHVGLITFFLWNSMPSAAAKPSFRLELLRTIWRFAAGMTAITVMATLLVQLDKVILSRILSLEIFGYYTLANVVAMSLYRLVRPVYTAAYPKLTNLVELNAKEEISRFYHKSSQLVSVLVLPAALVIACFSKEILFLWTRNAVATNNTYLLLSILIVGTALHCIGQIPFSLQLAYGWTRLAFSVNLVAVILLIPLMILLTQWYGAVGAAIVWLMLTSGYVFISIPIMHRKLLPAEIWRWYFQDVGRPLFAAVLVIGSGRLVINSAWPTLPLLAGLGLVSGVSLLVSALAANRLDVVSRIKSLFTSRRLAKEIHST